MSDLHVAVVGAGIGGLVAALELARRGVRVTVVERGAGPGGKLRQVKVGDRLVDAGPTVFTLRDVFDGVFEAAGERLDDHLTLTRQSLLARHHWPDGTSLDLHDDPARSADAIGRFAGADAARAYRDFSRQAADVYAALERPFIRAERPANPMALMGRAGVSGFGGMLRIQPYTLLWRALGELFPDPRLRQLFGRYATYCGSSPFQAPATLMLVAHVEARGVWSVEGGLGALARALAALAEARGVRFRFHADVAEVLVSGGRAAGLLLRGGERVSADAVVWNGDAAALAAGRAGRAAMSAVPATAPDARSLSAFTVAVAARMRGPDLVRHNVFFSDDYPAEFEAIRQGRVPERPTVYLCAQDRGDGSAPLPADAVERALTIVNAPADGDRHRYTPEETRSCEERTFRQLERCGLTVERRPGSTLPTAPSDFSDLFPGTGGALYGPASHGWMASFRRPGSRSRLPGLFLAGGSVHPGSGVPMAALSGRLAASSLMQDFASTSRSTRTAMRGGTSTR
ncbi:phytoene desaturase [Lichenibacterium minor]|uniref:Phytoene desaturase n=1 Tax=Lichenibacterium minor TaxID=2316528 RepID=A0A4Q2U5S9_9HYPH|nr:1-hydroxycarotenoid 3,4-desaturase CrtD [Lichenibacterium minor]RYC31178.1 phytoene desaturase [Lichenibacterium minor]